MTISSKQAEIAELANGKTYDGYVAIVCPYHDDHHPSMFVYQDKGSCVACGAVRSVDEILFTLKTGSVRKVSVTFKHAPWISEHQREEVAAVAFQTLVVAGLEGYFEDRGIDKTHIFRYRLGIYKGWYTLPTFDVNGNFERLIMRVSPQMQDQYTMRYTCRGHPAMYAPDYELIKLKGHIIVVFGAIDAASLCAQGIPAVTTTAGQGNFNAEWLDTYRIPVHVVPDVGEMEQGRRLVRKLGWRGHLVELPDNGLKDPNDYITAGKLEDLKGMIYV